MTSPVDTSVKFFHSGMVGAPTLAGVAGRLIALLDACLVDGFGALNLTGITVSGGIATAAFSGTFPALPDMVVLLGGATGSYTALNGEQKVTAVGTGTFQFATGLPNGTATGTITAKMAPAGWAKPFSGTNLAVYRSNDVTSNRFFLRVNDTNALDARVVGYETMTAISTGTNLFPTSAQRSGGGYWPKVQQTGAETVSWMLFANGKRFWFANAVFEQTSFSGGQFDAMRIGGFGDFKSLKATVDAYNGFLLSGPGSGSLDGSIGMTYSGAEDAKLSITRLHTNVVGARIGTHWTPGCTMSGYASGNYTGSALGPVNGVSAKLILAKPVLYTGVEVYGVRGEWPEIRHTPQWIPPAIPNLLKYDIVPGVDELAGRKLMVIPTNHTPGPSVDTESRRAAFIDITGPWG